MSSATLREAAKQRVHFTSGGLFQCTYSRLCLFINKPNHNTGLGVYPHPLSTETVQPRIESELGPFAI